MTSTSINGNNISVVGRGCVRSRWWCAARSLAPAPSFPKLKSEEDSDTLPSNGHEAIWRADRATGGFPFGTQIQVTVNGLYLNADAQANNPDNGRRRHARTRTTRRRSWTSRATPWS